MTGGGAVKTVIAFHQVRPIFYSSLEQSNLQKDNYALAPFYLLEGERCRGLIAPPPPAATFANYPLSCLFAIMAELGNQLTPPTSSLPPPHPPASLVPACNFTESVHASCRHLLEGAQHSGCDFVSRVFQRRFFSFLGQTEFLRGRSSG